jgi:ABC-type transporter Mla subunit MlaD
MSEQINGSQNQNHSYVKAVVYDLESENMNIFRGSPVFDLVRTARVKCVLLLHGLGVPCTESVILVAPNKAEHVDRTIAICRQIYERLNEQLRANGFNIRLQPIIEVLDLTTVQYTRLLPLAERRLMSSLDRAIDHVSRLIDDLEAITEEARLRRARINLRRLANNWSRINDMARRLGIDLSRDYETLVDLIDEAITRCSQ